jgi:hypothetical protein
MSSLSVNGRVNILNDNSNDVFQLFDKIPVNNKASAYTDAMMGNWSATNLSRAFFSTSNIIILQNGIRAQVYKRTRKFIGQQSEDNLKIVMRSIFLQNAANLPKDITGQIVALNKTVYDYCVPSVINELDGYVKYIRDVSTLAVPMSRPMYSSMRGSNPLEFKAWF